MTPHEFLAKLWQYKPEQDFILIWTGQDKRSRWFRSVADAAAYVGSVNGGKDLYTGVGLAGMDYGPTRRCVSDQITGIAGIGGDVDLLSDAHKGKALPRTIDEAISILPPAIDPTFIVGTGNGIQPWWLLKEPYIFDGEQERKDTARLVGRWHNWLQLAAANRGWAYDRLADLARVLRVPGTKNLKDPAHPKEVKVLSATDRRYNLSDFREFLDAAGIPDPEDQEKKAREWKERFADKPLTVALGARMPQEWIDWWMDPANNDQRTAMRFRNTWLRQRHDLKDQSNSGYDMALVDFGIDAGMNEQEIVNLIVHHRALHGIRQKNDAGYFRRTIAKAVATRGDRPGSTAPAAAPPTEASDAHAPAAATAIAAPITPEVPGPEPPAPENAPLAEKPANEGAVPEGSAIDGIEPEIKEKLLLCDEISNQLGIRVIQIVRIKGKDPTFHMHLADGIIEFTSVDKLINYGPLLNAIAAQTKKIIRDFKPREWKLFRQKLLDACIDVECTEEEDFEGNAHACLLDYLREVNFIPSIEGQRIQDQRQPMVVGGRITVCSSDFAAYLNKTKGLGVTTKAAASMLRAVGAKRTEQFRNSRLNRQMRWVLALPDFDPKEIRPETASTETASEEAIQ